MTTLLNRSNLVSSRKFVRELGISRSTVQRILKNDLKLQVYKIQNEPMLIDDHKAKRLKFANGYEQISEKKTLFSDEKSFDTDRIYYSQNNRICAEADIKGGIVNFCKRLWFVLERVRKGFPL